MKDTIILIVLASTMLLSCKKDIPSNPAPLPSNSKTCRIQTVVDDFRPSDTVRYHYDASGRIIKTFHSNGDYDLFTYDGGKFTMKSFDNVDREISRTNKHEYSLNAQGYMEKEVVIFPDNKKATYKYTYSSDGYLIKQEDFDTDDKPTGIGYFTVENGNTTKMQSIWKGDTLTLTYTYIAKENTGGIRQYLATDDPINCLYGKPNKNLMNTVSSKTSSARYEYVMDGDLVKHCYMVEFSKPDFEKRWYTYECP